MPRPMADLRTVTPLLKRGALLAAANWEVIVLQFLAESAFKLLLVVPVIGAAFLLALLAGESAVDIAARDARQVVSLLMSGLLARPGALAAYLAGMLVLVVGGAAITFLAKGGTVAVLVRAERHAPPVERPPLRLAVFRRAGAFRIERIGRDRDLRWLVSQYQRLSVADEHVDRRSVGGDGRDAYLLRQLTDELVALIKQVVGRLPALLKRDGDVVVEPGDTLGERRDFLRLDAEPRIELG